MLNTQIGNYRIVRYVNSGGVADIYEAQEVYNAHQVAIKVLKPEYINDAQLKERFYREARILANLNHPSIVKILFASMHQEFPVMAMEYLRGEDLSSYLKRSGAIPIEIVESFFLQVLDALEYAHANSVLHRDIKPSNIFITQDMRIKVLDFGIAKVTGVSFDATGTGFTMGTPSYMSPEQVRSERNIDLRSDIYSLGVTLYTMLCGKNPYSEIKSQYEIYAQVANQDLPFISQYPTISAVINKATQKDKYNRYSSIAEFKADFLAAIAKHNKRSHHVANLSSRKFLTQVKSSLVVLSVLTLFFIVGFKWSTIKNYFKKKDQVEKTLKDEKGTNPEEENGEGTVNNIPKNEDNSKDDKNSDSDNIPTSDPNTDEIARKKSSPKSGSYDTILQEAKDFPKSKAPDDF